MSAYRIKLSDGTTTINLYDGTDSIVREAGLDISPPQMKTSFLGNDYTDGERLLSAKHGNRVISLTLKIWGSSLSDLKTNIRSIERLLNDAKERVMLGYGSKVYLEYQWGDSANQSTFFDVLYGSLNLGDYLRGAPLTKGFTIRDARLNLTCKPFGRYTNQDIAQDTLENSQSAKDVQFSYTTGDDSNVTVYGANWSAQTFTTVGAFTAIGAAVNGYRLNVIGTLTAGIYAVDGTGHPTGAALASGTYDASAYSDNTTYKGYIYFSFGTPVALSAATKYALVLYLTGGDGGNYFVWRFDNADASFANGNREYSIDSGSSWTADASDDHLFAVFAAETAVNYQDVSTSESYGDVPARMYLKLVQSGAAGTEKVWVGKRSGTRQTDDLWYEGEDNNSFTNIVGGAHVILELEQIDTAVSGELYKQIIVVPNAGINANTAIARLNYDIASPPKGRFRFLAKVRVICQTAADFDHLSFGYGYSYGGTTKTPAETSDEYFQCAADSAWEILDLGLIDSPPLAESDIAGNSTLQVRIFLYATQALTGAELYKFEVDWFMFMPVDEGLVIVNSVASSDTLAIDGITDPPDIFNTSSNNISGYPDRVGAPFTLGRENTRIYVLRDDVKAVTFASDLKYQPQFIQI